MRRKIETIVDDSLYNEVKVLAAQERRRIWEVVQIALSDYVRRAPLTNPLQTGLKRFLDAPAIKLTDAQFRESMELDFFEQ